jgi:uncharacterized protein
MSKQIKKTTKHEIRVAPQKFEIRKNADGTRSVAGYFATWGTMSHDLGFREVLQKNCFSESLKDNPVACFRDHDAQMLLGKTQSGTLEVSEDNKGLAFRVKLPSTSYANDLVSLLERGDSSECSFGFAPLPDGEIWSQLPNGEILRTITNAVLFEGSILTGNAAAYPNTSANLRSCPADIRSKLKRDEAPEAETENEQQQRSSECECDCDACEDGDCEDCTNPDCDDEDCDDCPIQTRAAHTRLLIARLRS